MNAIQHRKSKSISFYIDERIRNLLRIFFAFNCSFALMFANNYLNKNNNKKLINRSPDKKTGMIIVIPCYREPEILQTLESLVQCDLPNTKVEVIVLINHSEIETEEIKSFNQNTRKEIKNWISINRDQYIRFYAPGPIEFKKKWAGAGLARKKGMDEAVQRFNSLENPNGIIVSLDADTLVEKNYLVEIENHFLNNPKHVGVTISVEHQKEGLGQKQLEGIQLYEKYLEYYKNALDYTGYPFSLFTIGSAFAVKAEAYVKRGGMNRRQAGEDFYFLQNLVQLGIVGVINSTKVYPSARLSDRVPFGTGPILQKWMKGEEDLTLTYNLEAFSDLKQLFEMIERFYKIDEAEFNKAILDLPKPIQYFLNDDKFWIELADLNRNCSSLKSFQSRFFQKFNAFKILKYLNSAHDNFYKKANLNTQVEWLQNKII